MEGIPDKKSKCARVLAFKAASDLTRKIYAKFKFNVLGCTYETVGLCDSGADISLISAAHLKIICADKWAEIKSLIKPTNVTVSSFTSNKIMIEGVLSVDARFSQEGPARKLVLYVIKETVHVPCPAIIGVRTMGQFEIDTHFYHINGKPDPILTTKVGRQRHPIESYYLNDNEFARVISSVVSLRPGETKRVAFYLGKVNPMGNSVPVLVTKGQICADQNQEEICVAATKSLVARCPKTSQLFALGVVCNRGNKPFVGKIEGHIEDVSSCTTYQISQENKEKILQCRALLDVDVGKTNQFEYDGYLEIDKFPEEGSAIESIEIAQKEARVNIVGNIPFPEREKFCHNAKAINNDVSNINVALTDERYPVKIDRPRSKEDNAKFNKKEHCVNLGIQEITDETFDQEILEHKGYYIPENNMRNHEDVLSELPLSKEARPYVENIFRKYGEVVSLSSMQRGNLSKYLGRYRLELKEGAKLPSHKRIYFLAPVQSQQMKSILEFMLQNNTIERANPRGDKLHSFACSAFLVPRANKNQIGRLVIDYSPLNKCLKMEPPAIPALDSVISELRNSMFFSNLDLSQAFFSVELNESSRELTRFSTNWGSFNFKVLPTGCNSSPEILSRFLTYVVHYELEKDEQGNVLWEDKENQIAKMRYSPMEFVRVFFDDLLVHTPYKNSYEESRAFHFKTLEELVHRVWVHQGKLNIVKSTFFKTRLIYLGWKISHNYITPDERRIQKVLDFPPPGTTKGWKSFVGCVNSLRQVAGFNVLRHVTTLSSLTSPHNKSKPTEKQLQAFHELKKQLVSAPLFSFMVCGAAPKLIFVDSSQSKEGCFAAVCAQIIKPKHDIPYIPSYLSLGDPTHRLIYSKKLGCVPAPIFFGKESTKEFRARVNADYPIDCSYLDDPYFGFTKENVKFSIGIALQTLLIIHNCSQQLENICSSIAAEMKKGILRQQMIDFSFNGDKEKFLNYVGNIAKGKIGYDKSLFIFETMATVLQRPITVVSSLKEHRDDPIKRYNHEKVKPMFYFLLLENENEIVARCAYLDKEECYRLEKHRGTMELVAYLSKTLPSAMKATHILELELYAILVALHHFKKYIGNSEVMLITDAKPLYFAFNTTTQESSTKITRWSSKLLDMFPQLKLGFCKSEQNLTDFLSKSFDVKPPTTSLLKLPRFVSSEVTNMVDQKIFTVQEFVKFANRKPHLLGHEDTGVTRVNMLTKKVADPHELTKPFKGHELHVLAITRKQARQDKEKLSDSEKNLREVLKPIEILAGKLSAENLLPLQKEEYKNEYNKAVTSPNMTYIENKVKIFIRDGMLFREQDGQAKLMIPPSLMPLLIAHAHLRGGHLGIKRLMLNLEPYYCPLMYTKAERFCKACLPCALVNAKTTREALCSYPTISEPFQSVFLDYAQMLPEIRGYKHILICTELLTGMVLLFPTKTLTADEFVYTYLYNIQQIFNVECLVTDNAPAFVSQDTVTTLAAMGVRVVHTSSLSPQSKGTIEIQVKQTKACIKKMLSHCQNYAWLHIGSLIGQLYNSSLSPKHGRSAYELLYGPQSHLTRGVWPLLNTKPKIHPAAAHMEDKIEEDNQKIKDMLNKAQKEVDEFKAKRIAKINKNRRHETLEKGDIILVKNNKTIPGSTLPLKTTYQGTPFIVLEPRSTTALVQRMTDNFVTSFHKDYFKKFVPHDPVFDNLPKEVSKILVNLTVAPEKLQGKDLMTLISYDNFEIPPGAHVLEEDMPTEAMTIEDLDQINDPLPDSVENVENSTQNQQNNIIEEQNSQNPIKNLAEKHKESKSEMEEIGDNKNKKIRKRQRKKYVPSKTYSLRNKQN